MKKFRKKEYIAKLETKERTITVYGLMVESSYIIGLGEVSYDIRANMVSEHNPFKIITTNDPTKPMRSFFMGWSICQREDEYKNGIAKSLAKKRFRDPITTQNMHYLNHDMCQALVENEAKYILEHLDKFIEQ